MDWGFQGRRIAWFQVRSKRPSLYELNGKLASPQRVASFYYHQYSSEDYKSEGAEDKGLPSAYSPTNRYPKFDEDPPATKMNDIRSIDGGQGKAPSIEKVRDRYARRLLR